MKVLKIGLSIVALILVGRVIVLIYGHYRALGMRRIFKPNGDIDIDTNSATIKDSRDL